MDFEEMEKILEESGKLLRRKNQMYGDGNVNAMGTDGVLFRITEKLERIKHLRKTSQNPEEEPLEDSWKDIIGFGVIGLMLQRDKWLSEEDKKKDKE